MTIKEPTYDLGLVKGASYTKEVIYNPRNGELQNIKTLFHELAYARFHTKDTRLGKKKSFKLKCLNIQRGNTLDLIQVIIL